MTPRDRTRNNAGKGQSGFILATSLILLAVLSLLTMSTLNVVLLSQKMATNQRQKSHALNVANSALRYVEVTLSASEARQSLLRKATHVSATDTPGRRYLADSFWSQAKYTAYRMPDIPGVKAMDVRYLVEWLEKAEGAKAGHRVTHSKLPIVLRITARARGRTPAARAVVQSIYEIPATVPGYPTGGASGTDEARGTRLSWHEIRR